MKTLQEITSTIQTLKPTLNEQYGVETIGVFGSYTKGEQTPKSDIDILHNLQKRRPPWLIRVHGPRRVLNQKTRRKSRLRNKSIAKTTHQRANIKRSNNAIKSRRVSR